MLMIFEWANDPDVRAASFHSEPITIDVHKSWFRKMLGRPDSHLLIVERAHDGVPVGQFRLDGPTGEVSVSIGREFRARGLGVGAIRAGVSHLANSVRPSRLVASIRPDNSASLRAFEQAGFRRVGMGERSGVPCVVYQWTRDGK